MSFFNKICTGLITSTLSIAAYAAEPGLTEAERSEQISAENQVDIADTREVIQVLYVNNAAEIKLANLVRARSPDKDLRRYANKLARDHAFLNRILEAQAKIKSISLETAEMEESAQLTGTKMDQNLQILATKPQEQFRSAFLESVIVEHQETLEFYSRIEQGTRDEILKINIAIARQLVENHLADAQRLQAGTQEPLQPCAAPAQAVEQAK